MSGVQQEGVCGVNLKGGAEYGLGLAVPANVALRHCGVCYNRARRVLDKDYIRIILGLYWGLG